MQYLERCRKIVLQKVSFKENLPGTSLVVEWVRLRAPNAGNGDSIPGQGTRLHMHATIKSPHAATERSCMPQRRSHVPQLRPGAAKINIF